MVVGGAGSAALGALGDSELGDFARIFGKLKIGPLPLWQAGQHLSAL